MQDKKYTPLPPVVKMKVTVRVSPKPFRFEKPVPTTHVHAASVLDAYKDRLLTPRGIVNGRRAGAISMDDKSINNDVSNNRPSRVETGSLPPDSRRFSFVGSALIPIIQMRFICVAV